MDARENGPSVGIVIPTLNEARNLPCLLQRVCPPGQAHGEMDGGMDLGDRADEVVVVDGGSVDGTCELARAAGVRVLVGPRGRGAQLALGAQALTSDVLLFLHADCFPNRGSIRSLRAAYADSSVSWSAMPQSIDGNGRFYRWVERAADLRARRGRVFGDSGLAVRRELYEAAGGFADLPVFEDVDLSKRLRRRAPVHWAAETRLTISARRWEREGRLRCTLRNWMLRITYSLGIPAERLTGWYAPHREP